MDKNSAQKLFSGLSSEQQKQVQGILEKKEKTRQILNTPQAQALLKKLMEQNKDG